MKPNGHSVLCDWTDLNLMMLRNELDGVSLFLESQLSDLDGDRKKRAENIVRITKSGMIAISDLESERNILLQNLRGEKMVNLTLTVEKRDLQKRVRDLESELRKVKENIERMMNQNS